MIGVNGLSIIKKKKFKTTPSGTTLIELGVSFKSTKKNQDGKFEWGYIDCVAFGKLAELIDQYFKLQDVLPIANGELRSSFYKDKNGNDKLNTHIVLSQLEFVPKGKDLSDG